MKAMLKVTLDDADEAVKQMPPGPIRHVGIQHDQVTLWFEADLDLMDRDDQRVVTRRFLVVATNQAVPEDATYLGTVRRESSSLVWHVFELGGSS